MNATVYWTVMCRLSAPMTAPANATSVSATRVTKEMVASALQGEVNRAVLKILFPLTFKAVSQPRSVVDSCRYEWS